MLENLRRLVARRNKDRTESSFKRSESFKRISIRKLDRDRAKGGRKAKRQDGPPEPCPEEKPPERSVPASSAPVIDYGQWMRCVRKQEEENLKELLRSRENRSPLASPASPAPSCESSRADSGLGVGPWPDGAAPRSLELPRPQVEGDPRAHRSLESAQARPRQQPRLIPSASADSGFSFSVSVPRLPDFSPAANNFFFRKRNEAVVEPPSPPPREGRGRRSFPPEASLYQVVVGRPRPKALRLDPVIFVPPERRRPSDTVRRRLEVREVRDYCSPRDLRPPPEEDLYESLDEETESCCSDWESGGSSDCDYAPLVEESSSCSEDGDGPPVPAPRRPPARLRSRRGPRLLVKPSLHRAPSTLNRKKKSPRRSQGVSRGCSKWAWRR